MGHDGTERDLETLAYRLNHGRSNLRNARLFRHSYRLAHACYEQLEKAESQSPKTELSRRTTDTPKAGEVSEYKKGPAWALFSFTGLRPTSMHPVRLASGPVIDTDDSCDARDWRHGLP